MKILSIALLGAAVLISGAAFAEDLSGRSGQVDVAAYASPRDPTAEGLLNEDYLTATGATVPRPGVSRAPTLVSRTIRDLDRHLEKRICSNC
jgi:hypothetical protein